MDEYISVRIGVWMSIFLSQCQGRCMDEYISVRIGAWMSIFLSG